MTADEANIALLQLSSAQVVGFQTSYLATAIRGFALPTVVATVMATVGSASVKVYGTGLALDSAGTLYVVGNIGYNPGGKLGSAVIKCFPDGSSTQLNYTSLFNPHGVAVDSVSGIVYVADTNNGGLTQLFPDGSFATDGRYYVYNPVLDYAGNVYVYEFAGGDSPIVKYTIAGADVGTGLAKTKLATFNNINGKGALPVRGIAADTHGKLYVCDEFTSAVYRLSTTSGAPPSVFFNFSGVFDNPTSIAVDPSGAVYVSVGDGNVEAGNAIYKLSPLGAVVKIITDSLAYNDGYKTTFVGPTWLTVDGAGDVYYLLPGNQVSTALVKKANAITN